MSSSRPLIKFATLLSWIEDKENKICIIDKSICHNLGYKQKIQVIQRNQVYFSSSNVSTDTTVIVKDKMLNEKFTFCFKITIKWNLTKSRATRLKSAKYKLM